MFHGGNWRSYITHDPSKGKPKIDRMLLQRVLKYARPYQKEVVVVLLTIILKAVIDLVPPLLFRELIDKVLPQRNFNSLHWLAVGMVGLPIISGLIGVLQRYFSARAGEGIIFDLRQGLYTHIQQMSIRFFTHTRSGEIISRLNNDVVGAQNAITGTIPGILTNAFTLITTLSVMLAIEWRLTVLSILILPLFLLPAKRVARILRDIRRQAMEYNADMSSHIGETLSINGALLVKIFGRQKKETEYYKGINAKVRDIGIRRALVGRWFFFGLGLSAAIGTALLYWVGGHLVLRQELSIGTIVAFSAYIMRLYGPISALSNVQVEFAQSMVSFERVFEYLDLPLEIINRSEPVILNNVKGQIGFHNMSFRYLDEESWQTQLAIIKESKEGASLADHTAPDEKSGALISNLSPISTRLWALKDLNFEIQPGQLVAIVGPSGAGKTSLTYLLPRLYDPTEGHISIDGNDLRDVDLIFLAKQIGMVTQETYLFHDTIRANLLYAKTDATEMEMVAAAKAAYIHDFIVQLPDGYDTVVGERGYRLSGGEKQRIAIARVVLKDPRILILDEATSHLDSQNESLIQAALEPLLRNRTSLVIAHRLSTILAADIILVLDQGRLVERGSHEDLLANQGLYAHLFHTQFQYSQSE